jgi:hypothetical protein
MKHSQVPLLKYLVLVLGTLSVHGQQQEVTYRHFLGHVMNGGSQPISGATVCGLDRSGRPLGGRIPCTQSQTDGSFTLDIRKWEGDTYSLWVYDFEKGYPDPFMCSLCESFLLDGRRIKVDGYDDSKPIEFLLNGIKAGKMTLKIVDDKSGQPVESGHLIFCGVNDPQNCLRISTSFPQGIYKILTPQAAFSLSAQWSDEGEWKNWIVLDGDRRKIESLQIPLGESKTINIRLKR